jgi:HPt (histidine-containing phosphotransfer) domain-containing protein
MMGDLRNAVEAGDSEAISNNAHRAKGALASIHAGATRRLCGRLEDQNLSVQGAASLFAELEIAWGRLCLSLASYLQSAPLSLPGACDAQSE